LAAHSILVRRGRSAAAANWRRALAERTAELADKLTERCAQLRKQYAMRLPTVTDRLAERFIRPLAIDRLRAYVKPAMEEARQKPAAAAAAPEETRAAKRGASRPSGGKRRAARSKSRSSIPASSAFALLQQEADELSQEPTGAGLDVPNWIVALEQEVDDVRRTHSYLDWAESWRVPLSQAPLTAEDVQRQLSGWEQQPM
jgi:hypothetical protein